MRANQSLKILESFHGARVLVIGDVMLDRFVYGSVDRISPEAPIPVLRVERNADMPGGAANVARNIAAMGGNAVLLGVIGDDEAGTDLLSQLKEMPSIDARFVVDTSRPTTVKTRFVADGQQVMRADQESRTAVAVTVETRFLERFKAALSDAQVVVLSDYAKGVLSDSVSHALIEASRQADRPVIVDPKGVDFSKYRGASILTPNRAELRDACGTDCGSDEGVADGANRILQQGICSHMVVTRGKDGMSVVGLDAPAVHLPTAARQVFDVSGAGDTVVACIALGIACGAPVEQAATLANLAAGIVVGKRGTATVTSGELVAALTPVDGRGDTQKLFTLDSVLTLARAWREQGLKVAFTNGCFDLLHPGHIALLNEARQSADRLIVGLNADLSIRRLKGPNRPVQGEVARATVLAAVKSVDAVVIFSEDTPIRLIEALDPDVLVKGADYAMEAVVGADHVLSRGGKVILAKLVSGHSTTETVKRIAVQADR